LKLRSNTWKYALVAGTCLAAGYFALPNPTSQDAAYTAFGTLSVVCILVGIHLHHPEDRLSWYFLATAGAMFTLGDDVQNYYDIVLHVSAPFPSMADALYLAGYPFLFTGVLRLTRGARRSSQREDMIDAAIISMGAMAISWHFLMSSYVHDGSLTTFGMLVTLAYPIMDIGLLFIVFSALLFGSSKRPFHKLIAVALLVMFVADFTYDLLVLHNSYSTGNIVNGLFLIEYVLIAVAALHPSMAGARPASKTSETSTVRQAANRRQRMPIVVLAGFIPSAILVVASILGVSVNVPVMAGFCLGVFSLVYLRMMWMIGRIQRQSLEIGRHVEDLELSHVRRDQLEADLRHLAFHDELTGLANRALLQDRLDYALASATRSGKLVAVCFGDLDGFKTVNDTLGHDVGDSVLVKTGRCWSRSCGRGIQWPGSEETNSPSCLLTSKVSRQLLISGGGSSRSSTNPLSSRAIRQVCPSASGWLLPIRRERQKN
jgi:diguanylate cyclase